MKKAIISMLLLLAALVAKSEYDSTYVLAVTHKYLIPEDVHQGDYVGYWTPCVVWQYWWSETYSNSYSIESQPAGNPFAINSTTGLITIADSTLITNQITTTDSLMIVMIRTTSTWNSYYEIDSAIIRVKEASYCHYVKDGGTGDGSSRENAAGSLDDLDYTNFEAGHAYLLERGSTDTNCTLVSEQILSTKNHPIILHWCHPICFCQFFADTIVYIGFL